MDEDRESSRIETEALSQVSALLQKALNAILRKLRTLLRELGKLEQQPHETEEEREWREMEFERLMRKHKAEGVISREIALAGAAAAILLLRARDRTYKAHYDSAATRIAREAAPIGRRVYFPTLTERQIHNILTDSQPYFSRVAYQNLGSSARYVRRMQNALAAATLHGETQDKLVQRLRQAIGDTSQTAWRHAVLIAQTERVRAQSQAQSQVADDAVKMGLRLYDEWSCAMIPPHKTRTGWSSGSRESHMALDGTRVMHGAGFDTIWGNHLRYPGDPSAPAKEICNCHCRVTSHVLMDGERLENGKVVR